MILATVSLSNFIKNILFSTESLDLQGRMELNDSDSEDVNITDVVAFPSLVKICFLYKLLPFVLELICIFLF